MSIFIIFLNKIVSNIYKHLFFHKILLSQKEVSALFTYFGSVPSYKFKRSKFGVHKYKFKSFFTNFMQSVLQAAKLWVHQCLMHQYHDSKSI